jgi:hypothetical protein
MRLVWFTVDGVGLSLPDMTKLIACYLVFIKPA